MANKTETEEQRQARMKSAREYRARNRELIAERARQFRRDHPEKSRAASRKYYETHKEERRQIVAKHERTVQERTLQKAEKRFQPWLESEDERLMSSPLTSHDLALQLGRTYAAVAARRARLRREAKASEEQDVVTPESTESGNDNGPASLED